MQAYGLRHMATLLLCSRGGHFYFAATAHHMLLTRLYTQCIIRCHRQFRRRQMILYRCGVLSLFVAAAFAQAPTATLIGVVSDQTGLSVLDATAVIQNTGVQGVFTVTN